MVIQKNKKKKKKKKTKVGASNFIVLDSVHVCVVLYKRTILQSIPSRNNNRGIP